MSPHKVTALFVIGCVILLASAAQAVDKKNQYLILGPGSISCVGVIADIAKGTKDKNQAAVVIYSNWLAGNLTAHNREAKATYSILGDESFTDAFKWTLEYCQENPRAIYAAAVDALIEEYRPDRYTSMPQGK